MQTSHVFCTCDAHFFVDTVRTDFYTFVSCNHTFAARMSSYSGRVDDGKVQCGGKGRKARGKVSQSGERASAPRSAFARRVSAQAAVLSLTPRTTTTVNALDTLIVMTRRRWIADTWNTTRTTASLTGDQAAHLARVLRAQPGQIFDVVADGFLHRAEVTEVRDDEVVFAMYEEQETHSALSVHLLLAVFKFDHFEWGIEKTTELGAARMSPILARRTEKHLAQAAAKRVERWRRIAREASQQSRRSDVPIIDDPSPLKHSLARVEEPVKLLLAETEQETTLWAALEAVTPGAAVALAVGPEGGWAPEEMQAFHEHGWKDVTLGTRILRAETAAIAALAITSARHS